MDGKRGFAQIEGGDRRGEIEMMNDTPQAHCTYTLFDDRAGSALSGLSVPDAIGYLVLSYIEKGRWVVRLNWLHTLEDAVERQKRSQREEDCVFNTAQIAIKEPFIRV